LESTRLLTADDLARRWQVKKSLVYHLSRTGQIPTLKLGRYVRFSAEPSGTSSPTAGHARARTDGAEHRL
jgi:hypothetical protein